MNLVLNLKNKLAVVLSIVLLSTLFAFVGTPVKAEAATDNVSFYYSDYGTVYHGITHQNVYIKVKNLDYNKKVTVHYKKGDEWCDNSAEFYKSLDDGYEIWKADFTNLSTTGLLNDKFCIKYEVNGQTYWDNNNGKNYIGELGEAEFHVFPHTEYGLPTYVVLKNLGYEKDVKIVYTNDGWKTQKSVSLEYCRTLEDGNEEWVPSEYIPSSEIGEYYAVYKVNGQTYYDSNFGLNYTAW
ncbi:CBM21 domain-containing protein [Clostridium bornimense]|uniref:CBM21 domain-containing protein n=1 Tax=Clostridium bornimense TaxID=1216932 RepID=UPI001C10B3E8|nr:CBM21 domain-containing protein [Clostridium bornimense]MBU5317561.1 CBM21 domain-containing protein [Clostridium bornimense]